jgi:hypothetical protein
VTVFDPSEVPAAFKKLICTLAAESLRLSIPRLVRKDALSRVIGRIPEFAIVVVSTASKKPLVPELKE